MQAQIQALLAAQGGAGGEATGSNVGSHMEVAKPAIFNGKQQKWEVLLQHVDCF